jgi:hypothetical protein
VNKCSGSPEKLPLQGEVKETEVLNECSLPFTWRMKALELHAVSSASKPACLHINLGRSIDSITFRYAIGNTFESSLRYQCWLSALLLLKVNNA